MHSENSLLTTVKKVLIIRFSSIGDIVLTSPVVRCLKKQLGTEIHFLTKSAYASIVRSNPHIDKVFEIKKEVKEVIKDLKLEAYDYIIDLHKNLRSFQVKLALRRKTASFNKLNYEKWLVTNFKINKLPAVHIVDRYIETLDSLGVKNDRGGLDYFIPETEEIDIDQYHLKTTGFIAFAIGAAHLTKRLPLEKIIDICSGLKIPVVLLGGNEDKERGEEIVQKVAGKNILNQCGALSIHQSASFIRQSHQVISHDTGMMHIAAAFNKPIISIWGNTIPEFGMIPYNPAERFRSEIFQVTDLKCRPCSKIGYSNCPKTHFKCMKEQPVDKIITSANFLFINPEQKI